MGADCKSVGVCLQWFESTTCHPGQRLFLATFTGFRPLSVRSASAAALKAVATASRSSGIKWPYLSNVRTADLWPRSHCTTFTFAPYAIANDAHVCLKSWILTPAQPSTAAVAFWNV